VALNILRISAFLALATAVACGSSSSDGSETDAATSFPQGGQGGNAGLDGGPSGTGGWPSQLGIDGGAWVPSQACYDKAVALVELLTPTQCYGQMATVDSNGLTVGEATAAFLGSAFSPKVS